MGVNMPRRLHLACLPADRASLTAALAPLGDPCGDPFGVPRPDGDGPGSPPPTPEIYLASIQCDEETADAILAALDPTAALVEDGEVAQ